MNPNSTVFHLTAISLEADWSSIRNSEGGLDDFTVAGTACRSPIDCDDKFIPKLRLIPLKLLVRPGQGIISTLKLHAANEHPAVRIRSGPEFEFQVSGAPGGAGPFKE